MRVEPWAIDYEALLRTRPEGRLVEDFLAEELPQEWYECYARFAPHEANVHRFLCGDGYEYLYDITTELVKRGRVAEADVVADRLVAVHGRSRPVQRPRDGSRMRRFPLGPAELARAGLRGRYDRGHYLAHAAGGGLDVNLFPQLADVNRGWSERGKVYRSMERTCLSRPGTYSFARPIYTTRTDHPFLVEFGLVEDARLRVELFPNCQDEREMADIERLFLSRALHRP